MIKAKIKSTGEVVNVRPYQTEIYDFMVCRNDGIMGELYMRSELTIIGDNELDFISLVKRMRGAQKEFESDSPHMDYDRIMEVYHDKFRLESEVDELIDEIKNFTATKKCSLVYDMDGELLRRESLIALAAIEWADDNPKWIRSIDEIPPIGVDVLTRVKRGSGDVIYQVDRRSEYEWVNLCHYDKVTHWMPIVGPKED